MSIRRIWPPSVSLLSSLAFLALGGACSSSSSSVEGGLDFAASAEAGSTEDVDSQDVCTPACESAECGPDGCGGSCGSCSEGVCDELSGVCLSNCGDGVLDPGETCDPEASCPVDCDDGDACTVGTLVGEAASCNAQCSFEAVGACTTGDGCCPAACNANSDGDCEPVCGNGVLEGDELCDAPGAACVSLADCDDDDPCTVDEIIGAPESCDAQCDHVRVLGCAADHARGIRITDVTMDQGVRVPLREGGERIAPEDFNVPLIAARPMLVRAFWDLAEGEAYEERDLRARLTLRYPDETSTTVETTHTVAFRPITYDDPRDSFSWRLTSDLVVPGMQMSIELFETEEERFALPLPEEPPRFPQEVEETAEMGVPDTHLVMRVMLVPFDHDLGEDCPDPPDLEALIQRNDAQGITEVEYYRQRLMAMNPVDTVEIVVHEPVPFTGSAETSGPLQAELRQLREDDDASPEWYYFGVVDACDNGPNFSGVGSLGGPTRGDARRRVAWGRWRTNGNGAETFVHELGHEQGRRHVDCGNPSGPDLEYPNETGDIDVFGWDIFTEEEVSTPNQKDYMSYCDPTWVSQYGWNFSYPRIEIMSAWDFEAADAGDDLQVMLYGMLHVDEPAQWWTGRGVPEPSAETSGYRVQFYAGTQLLSEAPASREDIPEGESFELAVPVPADGLASVTHVVWSDSLSQTAVPIEHVRQLR